MVYLVTDTVCIILVVHVLLMRRNAWMFTCAHTIVSQPTLCVLTNMECTSAGYMSGTNELHMWQFRVELNVVQLYFDCLFKVLYH